MPETISSPKLKSLFVKIAGVIALTTATVSGALTVVKSGRVEESLLAKTADQMAAVATLSAQLVSGATKFGRAEDAEVALETALGVVAANVTGLSVLSVDGVSLLEWPSGGPDDAIRTETLASSLALGQSLVSPDGRTVTQPIFFGPSDELVGVIGISWSVEEILQELDDASQSARLIAGLVFLLATAAAMVVVTFLVTRPLARLGGSISAMGRREYDTMVVGTDRSDEIGSIGRMVEKLRADLSANVAVQRDATFKGAAFMGSYAAIMLVDDTFTLRELNPKMTELLKAHMSEFTKIVPGIDPNDMIGRSVSSLCQTSANGQVNMAQILRLGSARVSLRVNPIGTEDGSAVGYVIEMEDVTRSWLNEVMIQAIETTQIKADFDLNGTLLSANARFCDLLQSNEEQLMGRGLVDLLTQKGGPVSSTLASLPASVKDKPHVGRLEVFGPNGDPVVIDGILNCIRDPDGQPVRLLLLGQDVTQAESELRAARHDRQIATRQQTRVVDSLRIGLRQLSIGDLTCQIDEVFDGGYEDLRQDFNNTLQTLATAMAEVSENAKNIKTEAGDISTTADALSRKTESTAATLEQTAAALDELTSSVKQSAEGAEHADRAVADAKANAEDSGKVVLETVAAMDQIEESSNKITSIIKVIDDIAFQTNLLALNAGVEAARAGEAGRGFAVVASEVRALAQRSSEAAREINSLIAKSGGQVKKGVELVGETGEALRRIVDSVSKISDLVSIIAGSSRQQSINLAEINNAVTQLDQSTQQNAARLEEATAASEALRNDAVSLVETVGHFKIGRAEVDVASVAPSEMSQRDRRLHPKLQPIQGYRRLQAAPFRQGTSPCPWKLQMNGRTSDEYYCWQAVRSHTW